MENPTVEVGFRIVGSTVRQLLEVGVGVKMALVGSIVSREASVRGSVIVSPLTAAVLAEGLPDVAAEVLRARVVNVGRTKGGFVGGHLDAGTP